MGLEEPVSSVYCFWSRDQRIVRIAGITNTSYRNPSSCVSGQVLALPKCVALRGSRESHMAAL